MENEKWVDAIKQALNDYPVVVPKDGWDKIQCNIKSSVARKRVIRVSVLSAAAVAASVLLLLFATRSISNSSSSETPTSGTLTASTRSSISNSSSSETPINDPSVQIAQNFEITDIEIPSPKALTTSPLKKDVQIKSHPEAQKNARDTRVISDKTATEATVLSEKTATETTVLSEKTAADDAIPSDNNATETPISKEHDIIEIDTTTQPNWDDMLAQAIADEVADEAKNEHHNKGRWVLDAGINGNTKAEVNDQYEEFAISEKTINNNLSYPFQGNSASPIIENGYSDIVLINDINIKPNDNRLSYENGSIINNIESYSYKHRMPIYFGIAVNKYISKNVSIGTGISYSLLSSTLSSTISNSRLRQKMHFIGIPINAACDLYQEANFNTYVNVGVMAEKCIYADIDNKKLSAIKPVFWSLHGSVGVQYTFAESAALYLEFGGMYYFKNSCELPNYHTDNNLNLKLQAGIRFFFE